MLELVFAHSVTHPTGIEHTLCVMDSCILIMTVMALPLLSLSMDAQRITSSPVKVHTGCSSESHILSFVSCQYLLSAVALLYRVCEHSPPPPPPTHTHTHIPCWHSVITSGLQCGGAIIECFANESYICSLCIRLQDSRGQQDKSFASSDWTLFIMSWQ